MLSGTPAQAQFKKHYTVDSLTLSSISLFTAMDVIETGIPGRELAFTGAITGNDTGQVIRQSFYNMQLDTNGNVARFNHYEDQSAFVFTGPRAYALCYDGTGSFYFGIGSNSRQIVVKASNTGALEWARALNHHETYSVICENGGVTFLGQDESVQGLHDFSVAHIDGTGAGGAGKMYGTADFEVPERIIKLPDGGYLMVGFVAVSGVFRASVFRLDEARELVWGKMYSIPGKRFAFKDVVVGDNGNSFVFLGNCNANGAGQRDSVAIFKTDTTGATQWLRLYGNNAFSSFQGLNMDLAPDGGLLVGGAYIDTAYRKPFVLHTDENGDLRWARSYGDPDTLVEEILNGLTIHSDGQKFYAVGDRTVVLPTFQLFRETFMVMAHLDDGRAGCDTTLQLGFRNATAVDTTGFFEQPLQVADPYPFGGYNGTIHGDTMCSHVHMVGLDKSLNATAYLSFRNPASGDWTVDYWTPFAGGLLELHDLQGRLLATHPLHAGEGQVRVPVYNLPSGLYLVRAHGDGWASRTHRVVVVNP